MRRSHIWPVAKHKHRFGLPDPGVGGVAVGPAGASRIVAQCRDDDAYPHAVADAEVGLNGLQIAFVNHGSDDDLKAWIAAVRALRPMMCPRFVTRDRIDDPSRLEAVMTGIELLGRRRLDQQRSGLCVKRRRYVVGRTNLLGADAL